GQRLDDGPAVAGQPAIRGQRAELAGPEPCPGPRGEHIGGQEPRVVPVGRVGGTGVAEPGNQPPVIGHAAGPGVSQPSLHPRGRPPARSPARRAPLPQPPGPPPSRPRISAPTVPPTAAAPAPPPRRTTW